MIAPSLELAGIILAFEAAQAIVAGALIALLLWYEKRRRVCRQRRGDAM